MGCGVAKSQTELSDFHFHFSSSLTSWDITSVPKQRVHQHYLLFCLIIFFPLKKLYTTVKASLEQSFLLLAFLQLLFNPFLHSSFIMVIICLN